MKPRFELNIRITSTKNGYIISSEFLSKTEQFVAVSIDEVCDIVKEINVGASEYNEDEDPGFQSEEEEK